MLSNANMRFGASTRLAYMEDVITKALDLIIDLDIEECNDFVHTSNHENPFLNHPKLLDISDVKCYFPCME